MQPLYITTRHVHKMLTTCVSDIHHIYMGYRCHIFCDIPCAYLQVLIFSHERRVFTHEASLFDRPTVNSTGHTSSKCAMKRTTQTGRPRSCTDKQLIGMQSRGSAAHERRGPTWLPRRD